MWQAIAGIGSSLIGGLFGKSGAEKQNEAQVASAREQMAFQEKANQKQMDFQERMSNTSFQRGMADMKSAGLNPILAYNKGGASSPGGATSGGAQANIVNEMAPMANAAASMSDKLYNFTVQRETVNNMKLQNDLLKQQVEQLQISNARSGIFTPVYEGAGSLIDSATDFLKGNDIVQDVLDAGGSAGTGLHDASPTTARRLMEKALGKSEATKWASGEKSFIQSLKDANKPKLTEEVLRAYGIRRLEELKRKGSVK